MYQPWLNEPDSKDWEAHGLKCAMRRGPGGHWCGYVGVPEGHPAYGVEYTDDRFYHIDVHGGLTYGAIGAGWLEAGLYWLGFDCAHLYDYCPKFTWSDGEYRNEPYVTCETESLARQLAEMCGEV